MIISLTTAIESINGWTLVKESNHRHSSNQESKHFVFLLEINTNRLTEGSEPFHLNSTQPICRVWFDTHRQQTSTQFNKPSFRVLGQTEQLLPRHRKCCSNYYISPIEPTPSPWVNACITRNEEEVAPMCKVTYIAMWLPFVEKPPSIKHVRVRYQSLTQSLLCPQVLLWHRSYQCPSLQTTIPSPYH